MMDELWRRCAAEGRPVSCLWASESGIYGRFGFGAATESYRIEIDSSRPLALRVTPDIRPLRLIDPADAPAVLAPRYDATLPRRAGRFTRDAAWWRDHVLDLDGARGGDDRDGFGAVRVVVLGHSGEVPMRLCGLPHPRRGRGPARSGPRRGTGGGYRTGRRRPVVLPRLYRPHLDGTDPGPPRRRPAPAPRRRPRPGTRHRPGTLPVDPARGRPGRADRPFLGGSRRPRPRTVRHRATGQRGPLPADRRSHAAPPGCPPATHPISPWT